MSADTILKGKPVSSVHSRLPVVAVAHRWPSAMAVTAPAPAAAADDAESQIVRKARVRFFGPETDSFIPASGRVLYADAVDGDMFFAPTPTTGGPHTRDATAAAAGRFAYHFHYNHRRRREPTAQQTTAEVDQIVHSAVQVAAFARFAERLALTAAAAATATAALTAIEVHCARPFIVQTHLSIRETMSDGDPNSVAVFTDLPATAMSETPRLLSIASIVALLLFKTAVAEGGGTDIVVARYELLWNTLIQTGASEDGTIDPSSPSAIITRSVERLWLDSWNGHSAETFELSKRHPIFPLVHLGDSVRNTKPPPPPLVGKSKPASIRL
jgi:hypothetical protein